MFLDLEKSDFIILKTLKDLPKGRVYYTTRGTSLPLLSTYSHLFLLGTHVERIKDKVVVIGRTNVKIK